MIIKVTQDDIDNGIKEDNCFCPIALAITRQLNREVSVCTRWIYIYGDHNIGWVYDHQYDTPLIVRRFIDDFDFDRKVEPFEFELVNL